MPVYEYLCGQCHKRVELFQRQRLESERSSPPCPLCGAKRLDVALSRFAFVAGGAAADLDSLEALDSDDPEAMRAFADRLADQTGVPYPPGFPDALAGDTTDALDSGDDW